MDHTFAVAFVIVILIALLLTRMSIALSLLAAGAIGLVLIDGFGTASSTIGRLPVSVTANYSLVVIPAFVSMGVFAKDARIAEGSFQVAQRWLGRLPGGLALTATGSCAMFAAVTGSSVATVATVGKASIDAMRRHGYALPFAAGIVASAGTLGVLIPPSVLLVIYAISAGESIGAMLLAGIVPGALTALMYMLVIVGWVKFQPSLAGGAPRQSPSLVQAESEPVIRGAQSSGNGEPRASVQTVERAREVASTNVANGPSAESDFIPMSQRALLLSMLAVVILFVVVIGGIFAGIFTSTEAGSIGAILSFVFLLISAFARERVAAALSLIARSVAEAVATNAMVFAIVIGASVLSQFLVLSGASTGLVNWVTGLNLVPVLLVVAILLIFVPLGMFLEALTMMLLVVPLVYPIVTELGYSGLWFGILVVKMIEISYITPPVGLNIYALSGSVPGVTSEDVMKGVLYFLPADIAIIGLIFFFPGIVTWLPNLVAG